MTTAEAALAGASPRRGLTVIAVMLATILYSLDWTIASVALPHMQGTFSATQDQISWIITSYIVASAVMIPTAGYLSRRFGRKRVFLFAVTGFTTFSMLCGGAESLEAEVAFRILQGAAGAFLVPISQAVVLDSYPREEHGKAMAYWSMGVMLGPIIGPTLGGYLTELYTWRWIFYINLPVGIVALLLSAAFVPETAIDRSRRFDWFGFLTLALGVGAMQLMFDRGERHDWFESGEILIEAGLATLGLYLFAVHSFTAREPFLNVRLLRDRNYTFGLLFVFIYGLLTLVPMVLMPPFLDDLRGYPIDTIGLVMSPRGLGLLAAASVVARISDRSDPRVIIGFGYLSLAVSSWAMSGWTLEVGAWDVVWTGFLQGIGAGAVIPSLAVLTFNTLAPEHRTEAASVFNLVRSIGSSLGVSIALTVLTRSTTINHAELVENVSPFNELWRHQGMIEGWQSAASQGLAAIDLEITRQAAMIGYVNDFHMLSLASLATLPVLFLLRRPRKAG